MTDALLLPMALASMACYTDNVQFAWEGEDKTSHLLHTTVNGIDAFVFAGTMDLTEWGLDIFAVPVPIPGVPQVGDLHAGFAIGTYTCIQQYILPIIKSLGITEFYIGGHSKGAGQGGQAHGILKALGHPPTATRLYEPPLFGGQNIANLMTGDDVIWTETFNCHGTDIVTQVPVGPSWKRSCLPIRLQVPDDADIAVKHKMDAVHNAIVKLTST